MGQKTRVASLARNAIRRGYTPEMLRKVRVRIAGKLRRERRGDSVAWAALHAEPVEPFARAIAPQLWREADQFACELDLSGRTKLSKLHGIDLGGGGDYRLLFFLARMLKPKVVVETGVAAGFSSAALLEALRRNGSGQLYSSDFPYFRLDDPERYIGWVVPDHLRSGWDLRIRGDRVNLRELASELPSIDLLHYDSDKSRAGREFALRALDRQLGPTSVIVFDDIQDNFHFRDWVLRESRRFRVFECAGKWVGLVGL